MRFLLIFLAAWAGSVPAAWAASCCGGGSASALILPKGGPMMADLSLSHERYGGYWDGSGAYRPDPADSSLNQYRLSAGFAYRLASRWQASAVVPYVYNDNRYAGLSSQTQGLGDSTLNLLYETFDEVTCVTEVRELADLKPAIYFGLGLTVPTGISPYDDVDNSFDITGRGFYRLDLNTTIEKSIGGFNGSIALGVGRYFFRPVNREYGTWVEPYDKELGDRRTASLGLGYSWQLHSFDVFTLTAAYSDLYEGQSKINGKATPGTSFAKKSLGLTGAWATAEKDWIVKGSWSDSLEGVNFPKTQTFSFSVSHVFF